MEEDFEVFNRYRSRSVKDPLVTIQRGGTISLNWAAFQALGNPKSVELSYSRARRIIRLRKSDSDDLRSIPVNKQGKSDSYTVAGLTFAKDYDIDISVARRYTGKMQADSLLIDLNEPSVDATGPRLKNRERGGLQGKQERRMVQKIAARSQIPNDATKIKSNSQVKEERLTTSDQEIEAILLKAKSMLQRTGSEQGEISKRDELLKEIKRIEGILNSNPAQD